MTNAGGKKLPSGFFSTSIGNVTGKVTGRSAGTETSVVEKLTKPSFSSDRKRDTIQMVLLMQRKENNP